ncbi:hypothetical protein DOY81_010678 [Sarcophaga bullata]|nr:hypothetical protein DOY81_010678 [Sarcophaga bullata]
MLCWQNEDKFLQKRYPTLYPKTETLKDLLLKSSVPIDVYIENRLFDHRLVKDDLIDRWPSAKGDQYVERKDYRNLMESYVLI